VVPAAQVVSASPKDRESHLWSGNSASLVAVVYQVVLAGLAVAV